MVLKSQCQQWGTELWTIHQHFNLIISTSSYRYIEIELFGLITQNMKEAEDGVIKLYNLRAAHDTIFVWRNENIQLQLFSYDVPGAVIFKISYLDMTINVIL